MGIAGGRLDHHAAVGPVGGAEGLESASSQGAVQILVGFEGFRGRGGELEEDVFEARELPDDASAEAYGEAIEDRAAAVDLALCHWGFDWFVLPNPMYGEWEEHIPPEPVDILRPTSMRRIEGDD